MTDIKQITSNNDLEVGEYYHCFSITGSNSHEILQCKASISPTITWKFLGERIWADDDNDQALKRWVIYGPIRIPPVKGPMYCNKHFGYGFTGDCLVCNKEISNV